MLTGGDCAREIRKGPHRNFKMIFCGFAEICRHGPIVLCFALMAHACFLASRKRKRFMAVSSLQQFRIMVLADGNILFVEIVLYSYRRIVTKLQFVPYEKQIILEQRPIFISFQVINSCHIGLC